MQDNAVYSIRLRCGRYVLYTYPLLSLKRSPPNAVVSSFRRNLNSISVKSCNFCFLLSGVCLTLGVSVLFFRFLVTLPIVYHNTLPIVYKRNMMVGISSLSPALVMLRYHFFHVDTMTIRHDRYDILRYRWRRVPSSFLKIGGQRRRHNRSPSCSVFCLVDAVHWHTRPVQVLQNIVDPAPSRSTSASCAVDTISSSFKSHGWDGSGLLREITLVDYKTLGMVTLYFVFRYHGDLPWDLEVDILFSFCAIAYL